MYACGIAIRDLKLRSLGAGTTVIDASGWAVSGTSFLGISQASNPYLFAGALAAAGNALTQGIAVATGLQEKMDWKSVAVSAIAAPLTRGLTDSLGIDGGTVGKGDYTAIAADAFGNMLGNSIANAVISSERERALQSQEDMRDAAIAQGMDVAPGLKALAFDPGGVLGQVYGARLVG